MRLIPLTSTQIAAIGFTPCSDAEAIDRDDSPGTLALQFQKGGWYVYQYVPMAVFVAVVTDPDSQGHAFHELVKRPGYAYRRATPEEIANL